MPFMVVDQHLVKHPKTRELARLVGQHPRYASGLLVEVWSWAIDAKPDGMLGDVSTETLVGVFGPVGRNLVERLTSAGFICTERCASGGRDPREHRPGRFHDWKDWAGKLVEGRERERLRGEHRRRGHPRPVDGCPKCDERPADDSRATPSNGAQNASASAGRTAARATSSAGRSSSSAGRTEPNQTEPNQEEPSPPPPGRAERSSGVTGNASAGRLPSREELRERNELEAMAIMLEADDRWRTVLEGIRDEIGNANLVTWFRGSRLEQHTTIHTTHADGGEQARETTYFVVAANAFTRDWLREKYLHLVRTGIGVLVGDVAPDVRVVLASDVEQAQQATP